MAQKDPRVDEYIRKVQPFAKKILTHLRKLVHTACPDITETIKWGMPHFEYKGIVCGMAGFSNHCTFGFKKAALMPELEKLSKGKDPAMGHMGRITSLKDLPADRVLLALIRSAVRLNEEGTKVHLIKPAAPAKITVPDFFMKALKKSPVALMHFNEASNSFRKEYVEWITEAKTAGTRNRRMDTAIEWIAEGKGRNWKYERKKG